MSKYSTICLLVLTSVLALGVGAVVYAQTTDVNRDFNFTGNNSVYNLDGISIGTTTVKSGALLFSDGTTMSSANDAGSWTSTSTGIIYNGGNVGIGVDSPSSLLDVSGNIYGTTFYDYNNTSYYVNPSGGTSGVFNGNVVIGDTSADRRLDVAGGGVEVTASSTSASVLHFNQINGNESYFSIDNGSNWGLIARSGVNDPKIGAYEGGALHIYPFSSDSGDLDTSQGQIATFDFGNDYMDMNSNRIVNLASPTNDSDAATKSYVDSTAGGGVPSGSDGQTLYNSSGDWVASNNIYVASSTGNVGIGTTGPTAPLTVKGSGSQTVFDSGSSDARLEFQSNGTRQGLIAWNVSDGFRVVSENELALRAGNTEHVRIQSGGDVGIGTTTPAGTFHVAQPGGSWGDGVVLTRDSNDEWQFLAGNGHSFGIAYNQSYEMFFSGGDVGIGDTSPSGKLEVDGGALRVESSNNRNFQINAEGSWGSYRYQTFERAGTEQWSLWGDDSGSEFTIYDEANGDATLSLQQNGNIGIGDASPDTKLDVAGNTYSNTYYDQDNTTYYVNPSGNSNLAQTVTVNGNDNGSVSLRTQSGNPSTGTSSEQLVLSYNGGDQYSHAIRTRHHSGTDGTNAIDFYVWDYGTDSNTTIGTEHVMTIDGESDGRVGINTGTALPDATLDVEGGNVDLSGNDINSVDKLDANTVDPVYRIGGEKYATYMAGMTGVKEETTGSVTLKCEERPGPDCEHVIDLDQVQKGSDLWLFYRTSDFGKEWEKLRVSVTPEQDGAVWSAGYELRPEGKRLVLNAEPIDVSKPVSGLTPEVSYRLTAPRFDSEKWGNRYQGESKGMTVPMK